MPYPGGATFDFPGQGVGGGRKWEDLGALRIIRGTRHASRARNTPQYIIACQGADVKGDGVGARARGAEASRSKGGTRGTRGGRGGIGIKKLVMTTPHRAQK